SPSPRSVARVSEAIPGTTRPDHYGAVEPEAAAPRPGCGLRPYPGYATAALLASPEGSRTVEAGMRCLLPGSKGGGSGLVEAGAGGHGGQQASRPGTQPRSSPSLCSVTRESEAQPDRYGAMELGAAAPPRMRPSALSGLRDCDASRRQGTWRATGMASRRPATPQPLDPPLNPAASGTAGSPRSSSPR